MKIKIRPRLDAEMVDEARRLGLDLSRIVGEALIRETEAELLRCQVHRSGDRESGDGTRSCTAAT
tara:strand:+ start:116 stop:310 length:195 start_codon:yes stop_codon:yes gene_type:complete